MYSRLHVTVIGFSGRAHYGVAVCGVVVRIPIGVPLSVLLLFEGYPPAAG
ncbi:MAG: hypothetical protein ACRDNP_12640 [Gaiellaceae bacterium]